MTTPGQPARAAPLWALVIAMLFGLWMGQSQGFLSSNDGSHIALARALALRGETPIDEDNWMTLGVDVAQREGHYYSDRPPGTALTALVAARIGAALDPSLAARDELTYRPASPLFVATKFKRTPKASALRYYQGTAWAMCLQACLLAAWGLWGLARLLELRGAPPTRIAWILGIVGTATAYAGYASTLFSHVSAAAFVLWALVFAWRAREAGEQGSAIVPGLAGLCGAWAIACDYSFVLLLVPLLAGTLPLRKWPLAFVGAALLGVVVAAYHHTAFGSVLSIGYDFNINFEFARERGSTFGANPFKGAWALFGAGNWSGWLSRTPIALAGLVLLALDKEGLSRRWLLASLPWTLLICSHQTPTGGAGEDYRYIIVLLPLVAMGFATVKLGLVSTAFALFTCLVSAASWWLIFWFRFELDPLPHPTLAIVIWSGVVLAWLALRARQRRSPH